MTHLFDLVKIIPSSNVYYVPCTDNPLWAKVCVLQLWLQAEQPSSQAVAKDCAVIICYWQAEEKIPIYRIYGHHLKKWFSMRKVKAMDF